MARFPVEVGFRAQQRTYRNDDTISKEPSLSTTDIYRSRSVLLSPAVLMIGLSPFLAHANPRRRWKQTKPIAPASATKPIGSGTGLGAMAYASPE